MPEPTATGTLLVEVARLAQGGIDDQADGYRNGPLDACHRILTLLALPPGAVPCWDCGGTDRHAAGCAAPSPSAP